MSVFNPASLAFNYPKNAGIVPNQDIVFTPTEPIIATTLEIIAPNWLTYTINSYELTGAKFSEINLTLSVKTNVANNLPLGFYQEPFKIKGKNTLGMFSTLYTFSIPVALQVFQYQQLSISPTQFNHILNVGDSNPPASILNIQTDFNWSIASNQPWITFSQTNGQGDAVISINKNITGFNVGVYTATIIVDDGNTQKTATVSITMNGNGTANDYLDVSPTAIQFSEKYQSNGGSQKNITVDSTLPVTITKNVNWLDLSETNLQSGIEHFTISTINTDSLSIGSYPAEVTLTTSEGVEIINVVLEIVQETISGLRTNDFYFAHARNKLKLTSAQSNAEAILQHTANGTTDQKKYKREIPYHKNTLSVVIGLETENLLKPSALPYNLSSSFYSFVKPIRIDLSVYDKLMNQASLTLRREYQNLQFINGRHPRVALSDLFNNSDIFKKFPNQFLQPSMPVFSSPFEAVSVISFDYDYNYRLSYLPKTIYAPADGIITFSIYAERNITATSIYVSQNGTQIGQPIAYHIPMNIQENIRVYTCIINLKDYNLQVGQKAQVYCDLFEFDVIVKPTEYPTSQLIWENEWNCLEIFNLTGKSEFFDEADNEISTTTEEGQEYSRIIETKNPQSFKINTGQIYTEKEVKHLANVLTSKKVYLQFGNKRIEVIPNFNDFSVSKTRRFMNEFTLKFDAARV